MASGQERQSYMLEIAMVRKQAWMSKFPLFLCLIPLLESATNLIVV